MHYFEEFGIKNDNHDILQVSQHQNIINKFWEPCSKNNFWFKTSFLVFQIIRWFQIPFILNNVKYFLPFATKQIIIKHISFSYSKSSFSLLLLLPLLLYCWMIRYFEEFSKKMIFMINRKHHVNIKELLNCRNLGLKKIYFITT